MFILDTGEPSTDGPGKFFIFQISLNLY